VKTIPTTAYTQTTRVHQYWC